MTDAIVIPEYPYAKMIADSFSPAGYRVSTMQVGIHRPLLAELNTHRVMSRNSASSRAIPVTLRLNAEPESAREYDLSLWTNPADPIVWASEQPGMQGGVPLTGQDLEDAQLLWKDMQSYLLLRLQKYVELHPEAGSRLHKSWLNRPLEWFMWHTVVITCTDWDGFFRQRATPEGGVSLAQPEFTIVADKMQEVIATSVPRVLQIGEWHLPYLDDDETEMCRRSGMDPRHISAARCARTSYLTQEGKRDMVEDLKLFDRLASADPEHSSPLEHVCTPVPWPAIPGVPGNLQGYRQLRHEVFGR